MLTTDEIIAAVIRREGGSVPWETLRVALHPADRGGWTRGGITARSWGEHARLGRPAWPEELDAITEAQAIVFYRDRYVAPLAFVPDPLRALLVDWAVTSGHGAPVRALQVSLKRRGVYAGAVDGIGGPLTRSALMRDPSPRITYRDVLVARSRYYLDLALRDPAVQVFLQCHPRTQLHFARGWNNRVLDFVP